jgi:uncharacterized OsmC-like protein
MPKTLHAHAKIIQGNEIALDNKRAHAIVAHQASEASPGLGPTPLELCLMSHAGCYANVCVAAAQKMRLDLKSCEIITQATKSDETGTLSEETLDIILDIEAPMDRIQRLHEVVIKNCPVGIIFEKAGIKIIYNLELKGNKNKTERKEME